MAKLNDNYAQLQGMYLFSEIAQRVAKYKADNPSANVISMGIGDVSQPLVPSVISALQKATLEMGTKEGFRGYGPEQGYDFLREAIAKNDYADRNLAISADEIFISDGSKCDVGNFQELFHADARIAISDPVYPVYVDSQIMAGRSGNFDGSLWDNIYYIPCSIENNFIPELPKTPVDVIYLCYPNNPTGTVLSRAELKKWVDYAKKEQAIILFDAAYEAYITDSDIPRSIYEIVGASDVAIEFKSFSKTAGFTGLRCAYTVVPKNVFGTYSNGEKKDLHSLWKRRQSTKYNGCPYIVQRAAEALYTPEAKVEIENFLSIKTTHVLYLILCKQKAYKLLAVKTLRMFGLKPLLTMVLGSSSHYF